jgi:DNA-binding transcriptional ArsR family regulator
MARAPATLDAFNAIAEPKRRELLGALASGGGELPVNAVVKVLGWPQPQVSKHLGVLRQVGLVAVRRQGRNRVYRVNADQLKPIHDWTKTFERFWQHRLDRIKQRAEANARAAAGPASGAPNTRDS